MFTSGFWPVTLTCTLYTSKVYSRYYISYLFTSGFCQAGSPMARTVSTLEISVVLQDSALATSVVLHDSALATSAVLQDSALPTSVVLQDSALVTSKVLQGSALATSAVLQDSDLENSAVLELSTVWKDSALLTFVILAESNPGSWTQGLVRKSCHRKIWMGTYKILYCMSEQYHLVSWSTFAFPPGFENLVTLSLWKEGTTSNIGVRCDLLLSTVYDSFKIIFGLCLPAVWGGHLQQKKEKRTETVLTFNAR